MQMGRIRERKDGEPHEAKQTRAAKFGSGILVAVALASWHFLVKL